MDGVRAGAMRGKGAGEATSRILLVDDSRTERLIMRTRLARLGYAVTEADDGQTALDILRRERVPLVLSDWMMPRLDGPALCRAIRADAAGGDAPYTYVILLTAKQEKAAIADGLGAGADDFLSKPVDPGELAARLRTGARLLAMHSSLLARKEELGRAYDELSALYNRIDRDLQVAHRLQRETAPPGFAFCNGHPVASLIRSASHVGGDHIGWFRADARWLATYSIDVSGHGIASALMAMRLAQLFVPTDPDANIAFQRDDHGEQRLRDPAAVITELNARCLAGGTHDLYATIAYAVLDCETGEGRVCRAGHPEPAILRADGSVGFIDAGGPPVGLIEHPRHVAEAFRLDPGDRLILYSDGLTEAPDAAGEMLGRAGLAACLDRHHGLAADRLPAAVVAQIAAGGGEKAFEDDVSMLLVERPASG